MPRLLLLLAIAAVLYILLRRVASMPPHKRRGEYLRLGVMVAVGGVIMLTLAGKMHWIGAALTGLLVAARQTLPVIVRFFPMLSALKANAGQRTGGPQHSTVSTAILRMRLDLETGALSGDVLEGPFRDWQLQEMSREQLEELRRYCQQTDAESLQLLEGYLEQRFAGEAGATHSAAPPADSGTMSKREAFEVLGLTDDADRDAIIEAHRKLMQRLHPDRGGSDYLAAKINQAKDLLLDG